MARARAVVHEAVGAPPVVDEIDVDDPRGDEVRVRIAAAGICHTDVSCTNGTLPAELPAVLGHEGAGVVEAVGPDVAHTHVGDRVVLSVVHACGACALCQRGHTAQCVERFVARPRYSRGGERVAQAFGTGTFSELTVVRERSVVRVPDGVPLDVAAVVGCAVITGAGAVFNVAHVQPGARVGVVGCGGVGLSAAMAARVAGAEQVVAIDPDPDRRQRALDVAATDACPPDVDAVLAVAPAGLDVVLEAAGATGAIELALAVTGAGGTVVLMGIPDPAAVAGLAVLPFLMAEKTVVGCNMGRVRPAVDFDRYFRLFQRGLMPLDALVTHRFPFDEAPAAFELAASGGGVRVVLTGDAG